MSAGGPAAGWGGGAIWRRYAPFVAILAMQAVLVVVAPSRQPTPGLTALGAGPAGPATAGGETRTVGGSSVPGSGVASGGPGGAVGGSTGGVRGGEAAGGASATASGGCRSAAATGIGGLGQGGVSCGLDPADPGSWPWSHPWVLTGDRSGCAAPGILQETVTSFSNPCTPRFTGDNGNATWQGVTRTQITVVKYIPYYNSGEQTILASQNLSATNAQITQTQAGFAAFFAKHFDLYGRKINWVIWSSSCNGGDVTCFRDEARQINTRFKPFAVVIDDVTPSSDPELFDELSRLHIVNLGGWNLIGSFDTAHRPYHWDNTMDGSVVVEQLAEYWCRKLAGKPASLAGDALLRTQRRKLGVVVGDASGQAELGAAMSALVTGGMCGTSADAPVVVTASSDSTQESQQATPIAVRFKSSGVTTVLAIDAGFEVLLGPSLDTQGYHPEHLLAGTDGLDYDLVARLVAPDQWQNAFGLSERPMEASPDARDDGRAWHDVEGSGNPPCTICPGMLEYERQLVYMIQWAGPNLTPFTLERGALESPQFNGTTIAKPWPGWKCCNPETVEWALRPGEYAAAQDVKEVYWDPKAVSPIDGKPGSYICIAACRRTGPGGWTAGEPVPTKPRP